MKSKNTTKLPSYFKPILWSYDFSKIMPVKNKKTIIVNSINYGNLKHWKWLIKFYGKNNIKKILTSIPATEIKPRSRRLASLIFSIKKFNYASRGTN
ncbi:MAG: hypothetical protein ABH888_03850 [Patescibacteria group bacterium]